MTARDQVASAPGFCREIMRASRVDAARNRNRVHARHTAELAVIRARLAVLAQSDQEARELEPELFEDDERVCGECGFLLRLDDDDQGDERTAEEQGFKVGGWYSS